MVVLQHQRTYKALYIHILFLLYGMQAYLYIILANMIQKMFDIYL